MSPIKKKVSVKSGAAWVPTALNCTNTDNERHKQNHIPEGFSIFATSNVIQYTIDSSCGWVTRERGLVLGQ